MILNVKSVLIYAYYLQVLVKWREILTVLCLCYNYNKNSTFKKFYYSLVVDMT